VAMLMQIHFVVPTEYRVADD